MGNGRYQILEDKYQNTENWDVKNEMRLNGIIRNILTTKQTVKVEFCDTGVVLQCLRQSHSQGLSQFIVPPGMQLPAAKKKIYIFSFFNISFFLSFFNISSRQDPSWRMNIAAAADSRCCCCFPPTKKALGHDSGIANLTVCASGKQGATRSIEHSFERSQQFQQRAWRNDPKRQSSPQLPAVSLRAFRRKYEIWVAVLIIIVLFESSNMGNMGKIFALFCQINWKANAE